MNTVHVSLLPFPRHTAPLIDAKQRAAASITKELIERIPRGRDFTSVVTFAPGTPSSIASSTTTPGVLSARDNYLLHGYDPNFLVSAIRAAGGRMRDNSLYGLPSGFQGRRALRFGIKYSF